MDNVLWQLFIYLTLTLNPAQQSTIKDTVDSDEDNDDLHQQHCSGYIKNIGYY